MEYLNWKEEKIKDESEQTISRMYDNGFVFTRLGKGVMHQTRSVRIDLNKFELSSENRRILRKGESVMINENSIPFTGYSWNIGKLAKDFYDVKAGGAFSVNKIKEIITTPQNFNTLISYSVDSLDSGFTVCYKNSQMIHYSYPFYDLEKTPKDMGLVMMTKIVAEMQTQGLKYVYLGSLQRPSDVYKLQFSGIEWFDGKEWKSDVEEVKKVLSADSVLNTNDNITPQNKHIHIIGIAGVATSAIAIAFHKIGWKVTGSDKGIFPPVSTELEKHKIDFYVGWHPEKIIVSGKKPDIIMTGGSGTSPNNPEVIFAKENNISVYDYPKVLEDYFIKNNSIVTVGTWGKTTSSSLLSYILIQAKMDPSYFTGGLSLSHDTGAISTGDWSVVEGDEYQVSISDKRPKFVYYHPSHLLLTSVSWDHADLYPTEESYFKVFHELVEKPKLIVACNDDVGVNSVLANDLSGRKVGGDEIKNGDKKIVTYGKTPQADYSYHSIVHTKQGLSLKIKNGENEYEIKSPMLGRFNAENITGAFAMAVEIGIKPEIAIQAITDFKGIKRRFEKRFEGDVTVMDCHAPTAEKASSILESTREVYDKKIIAIYEPNIGGRQRSSSSMYDNAFNNADMVIIPRLSPLKVAEGDIERPMEGDELAQTIAQTHKNVVYIGDDTELVRVAKDTAKKGDIIVFLGSHGFRGMIEETVKSLA